MGVYNSVLDRIKNSFEHNVDVNKNRKESYCDISYKGHIILKVTDCDYFCVLESPILMTEEPHGHTLVLFDANPPLIRSIVSCLDTGIRRLVVLFRVLKDRFTYYRDGKSFYFKVENVFLILSLDFNQWSCLCVVNSNSSFSYLKVASDLCKELCYCTGNKLSLSTEYGLFTEIDNNFKLRA